MEGHFLYPTRLEILEDHGNRDVQDWRWEHLWYNGKFYDSPEELDQKDADGNVDTVVPRGTTAQEHNGANSLLLHGLQGLPQPSLALAHIWPRSAFSTTALRAVLFSEELELPSSCEPFLDYTSLMCIPRVCAETRHCREDTHLKAHKL